MAGEKVVTIAVELSQNRGRGECPSPLLQRRLGRYVSCQPQ
jgi:hypothetical protein